MDKVTFDVVDYPELKAKGLITFTRLREDLYQFVCARFKRSSGEPDLPDIIQVNRETIAALSAGLAADNERMRALIAANEKAIGVMNDTIVPEMDAMDTAAADLAAQLKAAAEAQAASVAAARAAATSTPSDTPSAS
jgi:arabinogalactan endo-1,4-beta-galactosidase